jgi:hypothetical protein
MLERARALLDGRRKRLLRAAEEIRRLTLPADCERLRQSIVGVLVAESEGAIEAAEAAEVEAREALLALPAGLAARLAAMTSPDAFDLLHELSRELREQQAQEAEEHRRAAYEARVAAERERQAAVKVVERPAPAPAPTSEPVAAVVVAVEQDSREEAAREVRRAARRPSLSGEDGWRPLHSIQDLQEWTAW